MGGLVFAEVWGDHGDKTKNTFGDWVDGHASAESVLVHHSAVLDDPKKI